MMRVLDALILASPIALAFIGCIAFGYALQARLALGRERGLREAAERARDAAVRTLSGSREWEMQEVGRLRRLLDCHFDALVAEVTEFKQRAVPSPGGILEGLCSWNVQWKRELAERARLQSKDVDRLVRNDLPITPHLARHLEAFTGAPARYWEYLWRLYDEYRLEMDETMALRVGELVRARDTAALESMPAVVAPVPSRPLDPEPPTVRPARRQPTLSAPATVPPEARSAAAVPPPVVAHPELASRGDRGRLPPPKPRLRSPVAPSGALAPEPARRASTLTSFPVQGDVAVTQSGDGWTEVEGSPLNATLRGVGG